MYIHIYGNRSSPKILLMHPMGLTGEEMYEIIGKKFGRDCCVIAPDMGGHGKEKRDYHSSAYEAARLHKFLLKYGFTDIKLLYGVSLGAAAVLSLMKYDDIEFETAYLDGAPTAKLSKIRNKLMTFVLIRQRNKISDNYKKGCRVFIKNYGLDIGVDMADNFLKLSNASIVNIAKACTVGNTPFITPEKQKKIYFDWGEYELYTKKSFPLVKKIYPYANVIIREGFNHCEFFSKETEKYIEYIKDIMK